MILMALLIFTGCSESKSGLSEMGEEIEYEIKIRKRSNVSYTVVTDQVIKNNLLCLLKEVVSQEKIVVSGDASTGSLDEREIIITRSEGEQYIIGFSIFYSSEYVEGGPLVIGVSNGKGKADYYDKANELDDFINIALTDSRTLSGEVINLQPLQLKTQHVFDSLTLHTEDLPENIEVGSKVEVTLGKMTNTSKGLVAESIVKK